MNVGERGPSASWALVIDGVIDANPTGGVVFHYATGSDADGITDTWADVRQR